MSFDRRYKNEVEDSIKYLKGVISKVTNNVNDYESDIEYLKLNKYFQVFLYIIYNSYCKLNDRDKDIIYYAITNIAPQYRDDCDPVFGNWFAPDNLNKIDISNAKEFMLSICRLLNKDYVLSSLVIGMILGVRPSYVFEQCVTNEKDNTIDSINFISEEIVPDRISYGDEVYNLYYCGNQCNYKNEMIGIYRCYFSRNYKDCFWVFASREKRTNYSDVVTVGRIKSRVRLLNENLLGECSDCRILIVPNIFYLVTLVKMADEANLYERMQSIIIGYPGGKDDYESLRLPLLYDKEVYIVCSPGLPEWQWVMDLIKICTDTGANSIKLYPYPLYSKKYSPDLNGYSSACISRLHEKSTDIDSIEIMSNFVNKIYEESIALEYVGSWKEHIGLNPANAPTATIQDDEIFSAVDVFSNPNPPSMQKLESFQLRDFISSDYITLIWGDSGVGKSFFSIALGMALAQGTSFLYFKPSIPCKVLYINGERREYTDYAAQQFIENSSSYDSIYRENFKVIKLNINYNLDMQSAQNGLLDMLLKHKYNVVIFDNIFSLFPAKETVLDMSFKDFIYKITGNNISVIFVHHSNKGGTDYRGSSKLKDFMQNILHLDRCDQDIIDEYCNDTNISDGLFIAMKLTKTKNLCDCENKTTYIHLQKYKSWEVIGGFVPATESSEDSKAPYQQKNDEEETDNKQISKADLCPKEIKICEILYQESSAARETIDNQAGLSRDTTLKYLNGLIKKNLVLKIGGSSDTHYRLTESGKKLFAKPTPKS